jgi:hypothetical protein
MKRESEKREDRCVCARGRKGNVVEYGKGIRLVAEKNVSKIRSSQSASRSVGWKRLSVSHGVGSNSTEDK